MILSLLRALEPETAELLGISIKHTHPPRIDLSVQNIQNTGSNIYERPVMEQYVAQRRAQTQAAVVWGGYLEHRLIYASSSLFQQDQTPRNIHLGLDFYADAGLSVHALLPGMIHSFQDNDAFGDYGPTVILRHETPSLTFHSLYGHLSRASLVGLAEGQLIARGQQIGELGTAMENGNWPPHLHFQLILDMEGYRGDYPGVCAIDELHHFVPNCPDPRFLLGI